MSLAKRQTITFPDSLHQAAEILRKRRKYRNMTEYVIGLVRYDGQTQREHHLTAEWAAMSGDERDRLDAAILRQVEKGEGVLGSWLEATIEDIVQKHLAQGRTPSTKEVATDLADEIVKRAKK